jgi:predicted Zn-dependent protease
MNKRKPGTISKIFSSHPPTGDRIVTAQKNIERYLKEKPEYVVTTSEFEDVKSRILALNNRRRITSTDDPNKPRLRKAPGASVDPVGDEDDSKKPKEDPDERPTLKRRN